MNDKTIIMCAEIQRRLHNNPQQLDSSIQDHLATCPNCKKVASELSSLEQHLQSAVKVDVPTGLADRILLNKSVHEMQRQRQSRTRWYATAASVVLTMGLVFSMVMMNSPYSIEAVALKHVNDELNHLYDKKNLELAQLNDVLKPFNLSIQQSVQPINYAGTCKIRNSRGAHVILEGETAPVTVLFMPGEYVPDRKTISDDRFHGLILPIQNGSMAIISDHKENLQLYEQQITRQLIVG